MKPGINVTRILRILAMVVLVLALSACQGTGDEDQTDQGASVLSTQIPVPAEYASLTNPLPADMETIQAGEKIFIANCASCHGETGKGDGPVSRALLPKPSDLSLVAASVTDAYLYWRIAEGGGEKNSSMPAWKSILTADEIWMEVAFIRSLANK